MKRHPLFWKIYPPFVFITLASLIVITIITCLSFKSFHFKQKEQDLKVRASLFKKNILGLIQESNFSKIQKLSKELGQSTQTRFTVILPNGEVIGDSDKDPSQMDNHKDRPEVEKAFQNGNGVTIRYSHTLKEDFMYHAISLSEKGATVGIIRSSIPLADIKNALLKIYYKVAIGLLFLLFIVAIASWWVSRSISAPLARMKAQAKKLAKGDFSNGFKITPSDSLESFELNQAINDISVQLSEKIETITAQNNEQEAVFSSMTEGVVAVDLNERIIKLNQSAYKILEISGDQAEGKMIQEVIRNSELQTLFLSSLEQNIPVGQEIYIQREDSRTIYFQSGPLLDINKEKCGVVVVLNDISKLKTLERHRKEFVANVSHELRTPLTNIQGYAETLMNPQVNNENDKKEFIKIIHSHATRLGAIIEDLLTLSRVEKETDQNEIELKENSLKPILESAIMLCQGKASKQNIQIELDCLSSINVRLNPPLIEQAIINLLDNAIKYGKENSTVRVGALTEKDTVIITVKDEGTGIPKIHLPGLFERFYRVDKARSRKMGGTGLGLSIVKHITLAHHGKIEVQSEMGKGSTFFIRLPT